MNNLPFFKFNNISSEELGILVKEMPPISKAEKNIESITISGRNGNLHIDEGTYLAKNYNIACVLIDESKIDKIKATFDGVGILELSTEPNKEYNAVNKNQVDFSKYLEYLREFPLLFEVSPIAYSKDTFKKEFTSNSSFNVNGTIGVNPIIKVTGSGIFTLNNKQVEVKESGIIIDTELQVITKNGLNASDKVNLIEFPCVLVGTNTIVLGVGIEKIELEYKEGWL